MVCVQCGHKTKVANSRSQRRSNQVWRRRQCLACKAVFTTEERVQRAAVWAVRQLSGHIEPFQRDKLFLSLYQSCAHRKTAMRDAAALTDTVMYGLRRQIQDGIIDSRQIVQIAQVALNRFDTAASVHYRAFRAA